MAHFIEYFNTEKEDENMVKVMYAELTTEQLIELDLCDTKEAIDSLLTNYGFNTIDKKMDFLIRLMKINSIAYTRRFTKEVKYDLIIDTFLLGNWRT